jgi:hypothetical protein
MERGSFSTHRRSRGGSVRGRLSSLPDEVLVAIDDKTDALIRELEEQERQARRDLRRRPPRARYTPEQLAEVPF